MFRRNLITGVVASALLLGGSMAQASTITFSGQDDGAGTAGPFPGSTAAAASFAGAASLLGPTNTITFESLATGFYSPIAAAAGVSISLAGTNFGNQFTGISSGTFGNLFGFNTTSGGSKWLGFPAGSATFTFTSPTQSFGMWITGIQTAFTGAADLKITFNDGSPQTLSIAPNVNGGAQFFGFTSTVGLTSITITNLTQDAWGIDDVTYNATAAVPEPASLVLVGTGLVALVRGYRRIKK